MTALPIPEAPGSGEVLIERRDAVLVVTMNRPEAMNAIEAEVTARLDAALDATAGEPALAAIIVTGAGEGVFCADVNFQVLRRTWHDELVTPAGGFPGVVKRDRREGP